MHATAATPPIIAGLAAWVCAGALACSSSGGGGSPGGSSGSSGAGSSSGAAGSGSDAVQDAGQGGGDAGSDSAEAGTQGSGSASSGGSSGGSGGGAAASAVSCAPGQDMIRTSGFPMDVSAAPATASVQASSSTVFYRSVLAGGGGVEIDLNAEPGRSIAKGSFPVGGPGQAHLKILDSSPTQAVTCNAIDGLVTYAHDATGTGISWQGHCNTANTNGLVPGSAAVCVYHAGM
jgi:hypothetical protein